VIIEMRLKRNFQLKIMKRERNQSYYLLIISLSLGQTSEVNLQTQNKTNHTPSPLNTRGSKAGV
jgi:hypothetical protein